MPVFGISRSLLPQRSRFRTGSTTDNKVSEVSWAGEDETEPGREGELDDGEDVGSIQVWGEFTWTQL